MGQIVKRKKKGRPPKVDLAARDRSQPDSDLRRSLRRRNVKYVFDLDDYFDEDEFFADDDDERLRREKKLKHLLRAEASRETDSTPQRNQAPASSSDGEEKPCKKRKIDEYMYDDMDDELDKDKFEDEDEVEVRERKPASHNPQHSPPPPGTREEALQNRKVLELILDKLQKKDIYGVYAEPVDPEELPDYHDVIEHPMDFATVRNKLRNGLYTAFEEFESDVFLICSNAMQYNSPDSVYYKQAWSIQELAKNKFRTIRLNMEHVEREDKPDERMRSGSNLKKQIKRPVSRALQQPIGSDFSSGAILATADFQNVTNALQTVGSEQPGGFDERNAFLHDTNNTDKVEEPIPGKGALSRCSRKSYVLDENRRATYNISLSQHAASTDSVFATFEGEAKQLVPVGLYSDHSYARSLAHFSATLGSFAWKIASKRIEQVLPQGYKLGRGWVGEFEPLPTPLVVFRSCTVREPPYLAKTQHASDPRKFGKISTSSEVTKESPRTIPMPLLEQKLPFLSSGIKQPPVSIVPTLPIRGNASELKPPFFLSPGIKAVASPNYSQQQHQNPQSRELAGADRRVLQQVKLNRKCAGNKPIRESSQTAFPVENINFSASGSFKHPNNNRVGFGRLPDGKSIDSIDLVKSTSSYPQKQQEGEGYNHPIHSMRISSEKGRSKPVANACQVMPYATSPTRNNSNNASVASAHAWMSVGGGGLKPVGESGTNVYKNQIHNELVNNARREMQLQLRGECRVDGLGAMPMPMMASNQMAFQNPGMVFQPVEDMWLQMQQGQANWRNVRGEMKQELELNIGLESRGSGMPSGGIVDSQGQGQGQGQQPDLALQL